MISDEYRCIYVHIPKTAGTTIESILGHRGTQDHRPIRHLVSITPALAYRLVANQEWTDLYRLMVNVVKHNKTATHQQFREYFKFTIVRNPWARAFSWYRGVMRDSKMQKTLHVPATCTFRDFLFKYPDNYGLLPQRYWLQDLDGRIPFDFIGRFENLDADLAHLLDVLNIREKELPWLLPGDHLDYHDFFDGEMIDLVARRYSWEIECFTYDFEG